MKAMVMSDIHDNMQNLKAALSEADKQGISAIIFLGDFCAPPIFREIAKRNILLYFVFGNVDGEQMQIAKEAAKMQHVAFERDLLEITLENRKIAICHKPEFAEGLAATGKYDAVFYGHTHEARVEKVGKTLLANPGEVHGSRGRPSLGIYNTEDNTLRIIVF